MKGKVTDLF